jgi:hypothetical protein
MEGPRPSRMTVMAQSTRLGAVVAAVLILGCGGPSPDAPVAGQVSGSAEALRSASTSDRTRTSPGGNATVPPDRVQSYPARTTAPQIWAHVALFPNTTDGSCSAPDTNSAMVALPSPARLPNERIDAACVQRETLRGRYVQGQEHPEVTAQLQAQEQELLIAQYNEIAPMTYTLTDLENEPDHAHELWMEQVIQEVMNFDEP